MTIKLSDPQNSALIEISQKGETTAKPNTVQSLINKGLVIAVSREEFGFDYELTDPGREYLGLPSKEEFAQAVETDNQNFHQALMAEVAEIEAALNTNPWDANPFEFYQDSWTDQEKIDAGFEATLGWKKTEVWDGLTAAQIAEDMETAFPVGRQAKRVHFVTVRKAFKRQFNTSR